MDYSIAAHLHFGTGPDSGSLFVSANMQERLNEEIRCRERVIRIFPNDASAVRLIGALLAEQNEVWQERRYLDVDQFNEWKTAKATANNTDQAIPLVC